MEVDNVQAATSAVGTVRYSVRITVQDWGRSTRGRAVKESQLMVSLFRHNRTRLFIEHTPPRFHQIDRDVQSGTRAAPVIRWGRVRRCDSWRLIMQPSWVRTAPDTPKALISVFEQHDRAPSKPRPCRNLVGELPIALFGSLFNLLVNSTRPKLRATAYAAFAYVPGVRVLGRAKDQLGRPGTAIYLKFRGKDGIPADQSRIIVSKGPATFSKRTRTYRNPSGSPLEP